MFLVCIAWHLTTLRSEIAVVIEWLTKTHHHRTGEGRWPRSLPLVNINNGPRHSPSYFFIAPRINLIYIEKRDCYKRPRNDVWLAKGEGNFKSCKHRTGIFGRKTESLTRKGTTPERLVEDCFTIMVMMEIIVKIVKVPTTNNNGNTGIHIKNASKY